LEFLFERLAVRWTIAGLPLEGQKELLGRYRLASSGERQQVRAALAEHLAAHHPEIEV
jgi:DNA-binding transcriptional MerR regulator